MTVPLQVHIIIDDNGWTGPFAYEIYEIYNEYNSELWKLRRADT